MSVSEIAKLRQQLDTICNSLFFNEFAVVSKHEVITRKYEMLGDVQERLVPHVGREQAFQEILDALQRGESKTPGSS